MQPQKSQKKTKTAEKQGESVKKRPRGRPATGRVATQIVGIRVSPAEKEQLQSQAAAAGLSLHAYVRQCTGLSE